MRSSRLPNSREYPLVSIVVPTFNQAEYITPCLDSIMFQSYPDLEIIVVNDCSTDDTDEVFKDYLCKLDDSYSIVTKSENGSIIRQECKRYAEKGRKIIYHSNKENIGATKTYNKGFSMAKGEYATFVPSDDMLFPGHVFYLVDCLVKGYDFVYSDFYVVDDLFHIKGCYSLPDYDFTTCLADWYRLGPSHLFSMSLFRQYSGFDTNYTLANDYDLFLRFAMGGGRFFHYPKVLYFKRSHEHRRSGQWEKDKYDLMIKESICCSQRARK